VIFLDTDEFMIPMLDGKMVGIKEYIAHMENSGYSAVCLNWRWFPGNREFERGRGLLFERYRQAGWNIHPKTLFRLRDATAVEVHRPILLPGKARLHNDHIPAAELSRETAGRFGHINHYWNRSFQE